MTALLSGYDFTGCFAGDGCPHSELATTGDHRLPDRLDESLFATTPPAKSGQPPSEHPTLDFTSGEFSGPADPAGLPAVGEVIDKYRIEALIGSGAFAAVYRATHQLMRSTVALKVLHPRVITQRPHLVEQLCEEARFISLIDHPNVVRVTDVTSTGRHTFIVMEFIDGVSLHRAIERDLIRPLEALKIGMHICAGLDAGLHQGLVHRDIKPGNILIARSGKAKIVDFGLARNLLDAGQRPGAVEGEVAGTPAYMAPEQATSFQTADFRADIYSLGATLFHAATGRLPFPESDPLRMVWAHIHQPPPDARAVVPEFPERFAALLQRMLAKRPTDRFASYRELSAEMRSVYDLLKRQSEARKTTELFSRVKNIFHGRREPERS